MLVGMRNLMGHLLQTGYRIHLNIMSQVKEIIVPRCDHLNCLQNPIVTIELHTFSDSSFLAYGGCIYLKFVTSTDKITISFVSSK